MQGRITYLLEQRLKQRLTMQEAEELLTILQQPEHESMVTDVLSELAQAGQQGAALDPHWLQKSVHEIVSLDKNVRGPVHRVHFLRSSWFRYAAAVILLFMIGGGVYYYSRSHEAAVAELPPATEPADIAPGGAIATLTLSDGRTIALDTAADGSLARQGGTDILKLRNGQLAYKTAASNKLRAMSETYYNTIHIPRGGQYQVTLPDGSKVWLNAASSIKFPTAFEGRSREVEITGEAYFEIAKNTNMPFYVKTNGMAIEVLGTSFNVNAYADEPAMRTTLLEGSVRVRKDKAIARLVPGQQASISDKGNIEINKDADVDGVVAWKNGMFRLTSSDVSTIMRQLARWYDVEVEFEGGVPAGHITGEVPRNTSLSKVLKVFETSGIHFRIVGKKIVVKQ
jgi:ferric-dicitrate binding protein FerR (iron transport regulator)